MLAVALRRTIVVRMGMTVADARKAKASRDAASSPAKKKIKVEESDPAPPPSAPTASRAAPLAVNPKRVRRITQTDKVKPGGQGILYWMSRDQRSEDNWALLHAQELALTLGVPLFVAFSLVPKFLEATERHFGFMLKGLREVEESLRSHNVPFHLLIGFAKDTVPQFVAAHNIAAVVTDFAPLRVPLQWVGDVGAALDKLNVPLWQVDAHNIVPCWVASDKLEYGARTIRTKIHRHLPEFLTDFPPLQVHPHVPKMKPEPIDWAAANASLEINRTIKEVEWAEPGMAAAKRVLNEFCDQRLKKFAASRNDPTVEALSNLSPWFHFGQLSVQRAVLTVKARGRSHSEAVAAFVEESVVRRELADNFCFYQPKYDSIDCAYPWARESLALHTKDKREFVYTLEELEAGVTHDDLWNAAQLQMVREGKMHGFLRMYWAKKILEWTKTPEDALKYAICLNDRYELDGRDPNGYVGCAWSIVGIHDQGWPERPVFGKIRYMNYAGCKRKFNVAAFVARYPSQPTAAKAAKERASAK